MQLLRLAVILSAVGFASAASADPVLGCFVDTPGIDEYDSPTCSSSDFATGGGTTDADFLVQELNQNHSYSYSWSDARCTGIQCILPIDEGESISLDVTVTDLNTMDQYELSATAIYYDLQ